MATTQKERAIQFQALHTGPEMLVLPNAWDAASARILEMSGFAAIATTSSGVAAALGYPDGQYISRDLLLQNTKLITRVVSCPVTVDMEAGYGDSIEEVVQVVRAIIGAGAVGINIEDSKRQPTRGLVDIAFQVELIQALRQLASTLDIPLLINARTDVFLLAVGDPAERFEHAVRRANAYREAGADCLYPIGVRDAGTIAELVKAIQGPINILAGPGAPKLPELARLGVARVSFASRLMGAVYGQLRLMAQELREQGTYQRLSEGALTHIDLQRLWER